jgi:hypothetical protein
MKRYTRICLSSIGDVRSLAKAGLDCRLLANLGMWLAAFVKLNHSWLWPMVAEATFVRCVVFHSANLIFKTRL